MSIFVLISFGEKTRWWACQNNNNDQWQNLFSSRYSTEKQKQSRVSYMRFPSTEKYLHRAKYFAFSIIASQKKKNSAVLISTERMRKKCQEKKMRDERRAMLLLLLLLLFFFYNPYECPRHIVLARARLTSLLSSVAFFFLCARPSVAYRKKRDRVVVPRYSRFPNSFSRRRR